MDTGKRKEIERDSHLLRRPFQTQEARYPPPLFQVWTHCKQISADWSCLLPLQGGATKTAAGAEWQDYMDWMTRKLPLDSEDEKA